MSIFLSSIHNIFESDNFVVDVQLRRQSQFNARKKFQFAILCVRAIIRIQRLRFTPEPLDFEESMRDPYRVKMLRKVSYKTLKKINIFSDNNAE